MKKRNLILFLCESAWSGGSWQGRINFDVKSRTENRYVLLDILKYCNGHDITTIFFNKEDPTNFSKFFDTAIKFDHIFTTAEECVQKYKNELGHKSVYNLMFAAQPKLFNPIEIGERSEDIVFAGSWYTRFTQRSKEMKEILDNIIDSGFKLKIYDRFNEIGEENPSHRFPDKYREFINSPVPHVQISMVYKESRYALNINTVTKSNTMFARRVFELMLCNTLVLSNYSKGIDNLFGDNVVFIGNDKIDLSNSEEKRINNLYNVLKNHTYYNRFKQILDSINYEYLPVDNTITIYYFVNSQSEIDSVLEHYKCIKYDYKKLALILSDQIHNHHVKNIHKKYANDEINIYSLNYLLNQHESISNYLTKLTLNHEGQLQNTSELISNDTPYFIFANRHLNNDFIEKAILHYSYIDSEVGIAMGDEFKFENMNDIKNVLLSNENFIKAFNNTFNDNSNEFSVYTIQI